MKLDFKKCCIVSQIVFLNGTECISLSRSLFLSEFLLYEIHQSACHCVANTSFKPLPEETKLLQITHHLHKLFLRKSVLNTGPVQGMTKSAEKLFWLSVSMVWFLHSLFVVNFFILETRSSAKNYKMH